MIEKYSTTDVKGTLEVAASFAKTLGFKAVVALSGELGTGKTVFTQGVAHALGVKENVTSPSFTLINEYHGDVDIYHMDFYRLNGIKEILDIGVEDYFFDNAICLVEWAEKMGDLLPDSTIRVLIRYIEKTCREITIERPEPV